MKISDEKDLLCELKNGDHAAFEKIYHLYKLRLISSMLRVLKSPDLVEELLQDLFLKLWEQRHRIDTSQSLNAYLYKVAQNLAYDMFRKVSRDKKLYDYLLSAANNSYDHIEEYLYRKANKEQFSKAIRLLPAQQQKVFILCKIEEKTYEEAGRILNISTGTVNNHMHRANLFLKKYFSKQSSAVTATLVIHAIFQGL